MQNSKRYMVTLIAAIVLSGLAGFSIFEHMETTATACVAGVMTILSTYIWGETKRPSDTNKNDKK